jgi:hypothetical protein
MKPTSPVPKRSSERAAALIIVLAFVVLLTGLSVAYFSRATTDRQLAHTSFRDTDADVLARTALDTVVGDFKQEIRTGSTTSGPPFIPSQQAYVVPMRSGNPAIPGGLEANDPIPNLTRRSVYPDALNGNPGFGSRASATNSTTASANGRSVSLAKWNSHYLIPRDPSATGDDSTPVNTFVAPDWVIVTRGTPTPFPAWNPALKDPTATNTTYAVGRYAYAVYDEGGLLDINVAGYPSPTPAQTSLTAGPSVRDVGRKGVLAFGDLTALPTTPGNYMSGTAINTLIGFRNYATMQLNGVSGLNFPPFSATAVSNFFSYFTMPSPIPASSPLQLGTSNDFGMVNTVSTGSLSDSSLRTDQNFISRTELINVFKSTGIANLNTLQYLGTFSREQNKPTLPLTPNSMWPFTRVVLPQRFYLGNLNDVVNPGNAANIRQHFGLQFASVGNPGTGPCDNQVRWKYVGQDANPNATPRPDVSSFPSDLTTLDFFQYINYALFGVNTTDSNPTHIASTLQIGASIIDQYDADGQSTGIYYGSNPATCDLSPAINACLVYGLEQNGSYVPPTCISSTAPTLTNISVNRPLRSVGEFSYGYNLLDAINNHNGVNYLSDFKDPYDSVTNPDPALLDFFTYNAAPVRSGIVSLNTRQPPVLAAILKGAIYNKNNNDASYTTGVVGTPDVNTVSANLDATKAAKDIVNAAAVTPALSRADIARLASAGVVITSPFTSDEEARDTIARALSEVVQTRTWGLLIDLVAQTGHYAPNAAGLADFIVEGEKRYWLHVAVDRFDGTIVGQQLEEVTE